MKLGKSIWTSLKNIFSKTDENNTEQTPIEQNEENNLAIESLWDDKIPDHSLSSDLDLKIPGDVIQQPDDIDVSVSSQSPVLGDSGVQEIDLVIGFDFGTSTSKVVIQAPDLPGSPARAINFGGLAIQDFPYLIPTKLWIDEDGEISIVEKKGYKQISDLKIRLLPGVNVGIGTTSNDLNAAGIAICYIAEVLRISRKWYLAENINLIGKGTKINWSFNLGVPSPYVGKNIEHNLFKLIGRGAWIYSVLDPDSRRFNLYEAVRVYESLNHKDEWPNYTSDYLKCEFNIIPEIAGGAVGYAFSDKRRNGLHLMIDVGAGTVDVCMFILWNKNDSNSYSLLTADVKPLGTAMYQRHMLNIISSKTYSKNKIKFKYNALHAPINDMRKFIEYFNSYGYNNISESQLEAHKLKFEKQVEEVLKRIVWRTKKDRDLQASTWKNNKTLPLIMIGGGSKSDIYIGLIQRLNSWMLSQVRNGGFSEILSVQLPALAKDIKPEYLTVAWGLSHRALDIGKIIPPDEIDDIPPLPPSDPISRNDDD